ncbi:MAG: hypothetical protein AB7O52_09595 [Planctomycetota bacterium]
MQRRRRPIVIVLAVVVFAWLANGVVLMSGCNPVEDLRAALADFGHDPSSAHVLGAAYGSGWIGVKGTVRFGLPDQREVRISGVRPFAFAGWSIREVETVRF